MDRKEETSERPCGPFRNSDVRPALAGLLEIRYQIVGDGRTDHDRFVVGCSS